MHLAILLLVGMSCTAIGFIAPRDASGAVSMRVPQITDVRHSYEKKLETGNAPALRLRGGGRRYVQICVVSCLSVGVQIFSCSCPLHPANFDRYRCTTTPAEHENSSRRSQQRQHEINGRRTNAEQKRRRVSVRQVSLPSMSSLHPFLYKYVG